MKLQDMGFVLLSIIGLGMAPVQPTAQTYAWQNGALYQRTRIPERTYTLPGYIAGASQAEVKRTKALIESYLLPSINQQPILMQYEYADENGRPTGEVLNLPSVYSGGMEGKAESLYSEKVAPKFTMYMPLVMRDGNDGANLNYTQTVTNTAFSAARINGQWQALGRGFASAVYCTKADPAHGRVWFGGGFATVTQTDGTSLTVNGLTYWDIQAQKFVAVGGATKGIGGGGGILGLVIDANGNVWVLGTYTTAGGATTKGIARWNAATDTFTVFNIAGTVTAFYGGAIDGNGLAYFVGNFTGWNGDATQAYVTSYSTLGTWAAVGTSPFGADDYGAYGTCTAVDSNNNLYVGSKSASGAAHLRRWNGAAWTDLGATNTNASIQSVFIDTDGMVYIAGSFNSIAGLTIWNVAKYNLATFMALGSLLNVSGTAAGIIGDGKGNIFVVGYFQLTGFGSAYWTLAFWNGSVWTPYDITSAASGGAYANVSYLNGSLFINWTSESGTSSTAAYLSTVTNNSSTDAFPVITITGPGTLFQIKNETTGDLLSFNLVLQAGEVATLDLTGGSVKFTSTWRGSILSALLNGGNDSTFRLIPGANKIAVYMAGSTTAATAVDMRWTPQYLGLEH